MKILWGVFKTLDKATGGWIKAQNILFLCLVTNKITIPLFFSFYRPDPKYKKWEVQDKKLRKNKVRKKDRPKPPPKNSHYPSRSDIALKLLTRLKKFLEQIEPTIGKIKIKSILFDSFYCSPRMFRSCRKIFPKVQAISQLAKTQKVSDSSKIKHSVKDYFARQQPVESKINLRGNCETVFYLSARLFVKSHGEKLHVIALRYQGEEDYRYLVCSQLNWRSTDIIRAYALRWLVEVVIFDWKQHDGWGRKAYQQGADGACRGVILSLLVDCFLVTHPAQIRQSRVGQPLWTAGSVVRRVQYDNILENIDRVFSSSDPQESLKALVSSVENVIQLRPSTKHMIGVEIDDLAPSPSLTLRWGA